MIKNYLKLLPLILLLAACGSSPPVPTDSFYRLTLPAQGIQKVRITDRSVHVGHIIGEGLYNERAILYTNDENSRKIIQYHYHFWLTTPPRMLREHLVEFLRASDTGPMVLTDSSKGDGLRISGRILDFEKQSVGDAVTANVGLELRIDVGGEDLPRFIKQYRVKEPVSGSSMSDVVEGFNTAVLKIFGEFAADISTVAR